jgi:hypothetical protein
MSLTLHCFRRPIIHTYPAGRTIFIYPIHVMQAVNIRCGLHTTPPFHHIQSSTHCASLSTQSSLSSQHSPVNLSTRGGPTCIHGYATEYPLFCDKKFVYTVYACICIKKLEIAQEFPMTNAHQPETHTAQLPTHTWGPGQSPVSALQDPICSRAPPVLAFPHMCSSNPYLRSYVHLSCPVFFPSLLLAYEAPNLDLRHRHQAQTFEDCS